MWKQGIKITGPPAKLKGLKSQKVKRYPLCFFIKDQNKDISGSKSQKVTEQVGKFLPFPTTEKKRALWA